MQHDMVVFWTPYNLSIFIEAWTKHCSQPFNVDNSYPYGDFIFDKSMGFIET